jgi:hypothetical protein
MINATGQQKPYRRRSNRIQPVAMAHLEGWTTKISFKALYLLGEVSLGEMTWEIRMLTCSLQ